MWIVKHFTNQLLFPLLTYSCGFTQEKLHPIKEMSSFYYAKHSFSRLDGLVRIQCFSPLVWFSDIWSSAAWCLLPQQWEKDKDAAAYKYWGQNLFVTQSGPINHNILAWMGLSKRKQSFPFALIIFRGTYAQLKLN